MDQRAVYLCALLALPAYAKGEKPYQWPASPSPEIVQAALKQKTLSGLMILEKRCTLRINSWGTTPMDVTRDEFVRYLVMNEEGVRGATAKVNDSVNASIEEIQARTMTPDGREVPADETRDIHRVDLKKLEAKEALLSLATVNFPAPAKGALLDLHFVTKIDGFAAFIMETLTDDETPSLKTDYLIEIKGGVPGLHWSVVLLNDPDGRGSLKVMGTGHMEVHMGLVPAVKEEPLAIPSFRTRTTLLAYIDFTSPERREKLPKGGRYSLWDVDPMGRATGVTLEDDAFRGWWAEFLQDHAKACKEFLKRPGDAADLPLESIAPASLSIEERVRKLYAHVQGTLRYSGDDDKRETLASVLKKGEQTAWQGTLYLSYLLTRASIPHRQGVVANRYFFSFSPSLTNTFLFDFADALVVDVPGREPLYLMPGRLSLPFGCLPEEHEYSVALVPWGEKDARLLLTPLNPAGLDRREYRYEADLQPGGALQGTMTYEVTGAPGEDLWWWHQEQEYQRSHPDRERDKKVTDRDRQRQADERIKEEIRPPGDRLVFESAAIERTAGTGLEIKGHFRASGMAQEAGDRWLLAICPPLAGYTHPFTDEARRSPVWCKRGGRVVLEGVITLPKGSEVLDVPLPEEFVGPGGAKVLWSAERVEKGGLPGLKTRVEYDQPLIVPTTEYPQWRAYQAVLVRVAEARALVRIPLAAGELE